MHEVSENHLLTIADELRETLNAEDSDIERVFWCATAVGDGF